MGVGVGVGRTRENPVSREEDQRGGTREGPVSREGDQRGGLESPVSREGGDQSESGLQGVWRYGRPEQVIKAVKWLIIYLSDSLVECLEGRGGRGRSRRSEREVGGGGGTEV